MHLHCTGSLLYKVDELYSNSYTVLQYTMVGLILIIIQKLVAIGQFCLSKYHFCQHF